MDEIEYKLNTNNSVLIVNAIDKLISTIKSKYKPAERQKFVLENEELKFLRDKCSSKQSLISLTACQGLLALVEVGVLEIAHTMSTVVTLLPSAHNYSAIISTMAGLLILDLRSRLVPGQPYRCQFSLQSPQHPFITVMEKNKDAEDDVLTQMHALCTHPDYVVSSNSLELLRPVFLWLTCNPQRKCSLRPWQLLLSLPNSQAQSDLLLACISCQQISNPKLVESAFSAYSTVTDNAIYRQRNDHVMALLPLLARVSNELVTHGRDPRACYTLLERAGGVQAAGLRASAGLTVTLLALNLPRSSALHLHSLFNLGLNIMAKYEVSTLSLSTFVALSLPWLHLPSQLTASALKTASQILETHLTAKQDSRLYLTNLKANQTFQQLLNTDNQLYLIFKLHETWERLKDDAVRMNAWLDSFYSVGDDLKVKVSSFFFGLIMEVRQENWYEGIVLKALKIVVGLVDFKKDISVQLLPVLLYKISNDFSPSIKLECLKALPLMAKTKENVPTIVSILNKLKTSKGVPTSFLIMLYTSLAETQTRCFPYLKELLVEGVNRPDDLKWEVDLARAIAVKRICEIRASSHGLELVSVISSTLNRCTDKGGALASASALSALAALWRGAAVAPPGAWRALRHKLRPDTRPPVQIALCELLSEIPALRASTPEYDALISEAAQELWRLIAESHQPDVAAAACLALRHYRLEDYKLKDVPEIYRRTVKLPASYCKTPADAARNPEDVLDYIPCEIWPEVYKYTYQAALPSVVQFVTKLVDREIRGYRSGVYQVANRAEPTTAEYLPPHSVVRGLLDCFRKQATSPSYDFPEPVLLAILSTLSAEYPRPLPPLELSWLHGAGARGRAWRGPAVRLAAKGVGASARRVVEVYLKEAEEQTEESEALELFELLPTLCRNTPPNSLRGPLERLLHAAYTDTLHKRNPKDKHVQTLFQKQMEIVKVCLESDKIHDANRTLLSQFVENYYNIIEDDNVAWPTFAATCCALSSAYLERMTSPSSWWEVSAPALRRGASVRAQLATQGHNSLVWLNEIIDAQAGQLTEQEYSLSCMLPALQAARADEEARDWLLQLMARTQVAFKQSEEPSSKLYLCDVFALSVAAFSGYATCTNASDVAGSACSRARRTELLPAAVAALCGRPAWRDHVRQMLEWLCHTRDWSPEPALARATQRALLALRHTQEFHRVWPRLESYFGRHEHIED